MNTVHGSREEKESDLTPEVLPLGEWIEFGRKLQSASDEEILSLIGSVVIYLKDKMNDETFPSTHYNYREYVRGYANMILKAAQGELAKRHSERLG
jgi:hypothetical protein